MAKAGYKEAKKSGIVKSDEIRFPLELRVTGSKVTSKQMQKVYDIANLYGKGYIHVMSQNRIVIPFIKIEDIERIKKELASSGLELSA